MYISIDKILIFLGIIFSVFYGSQAVEIFQRNEIGKKYINNNTSWWIHQRWINLVGSAIGWFLLYLLYQDLSKLETSQLITNIIWSHVIIFIVGVMGIMGFLPLAIWGLALSFKSFSELIKGKN